MEGNPRREDREEAATTGARAQDGDARSGATGADKQPEVTTTGSEGSEGSSGSKESSAEVERLQAELESARKRIDELARGVQALTRDKEDFKLRLSRERDRMMDVEKGNVALSLIEALDDLDLCLSAAANDESPLAKGVRLIRAGLLKRVEHLGVERLDVVGKPYDPNLAEASDMEVTPNKEEDQHVTAEVRAGYRLKERVIRPARVRVAKYVRPAEA